MCNVRLWPTFLLVLAANSPIPIYHHYLYMLARNASDILARHSPPLTAHADAVRLRFLAKVNRLLVKRKFTFRQRCSMYCTLPRLNLQGTQCREIRQQSIGQGGESVDPKAPGNPRQRNIARYQAEVNLAAFQQREGMGR